MSGERAYGWASRAIMAFETEMGVPPASGYQQISFISSNLGKTQPQTASETITGRRDPSRPYKDVITHDGDMVLPVNLKQLGLFLTLTLGEPVTTASKPTASFVFASQPANGNSITINGLVLTFASSAGGANDIQIGASLTDTIDEAADVINNHASPLLDNMIAERDGADTLLVTYQVDGGAGNAIEIASVGAAITPSGTTMSGGYYQHVFTSGSTSLPSATIEIGHPQVPAYHRNIGVRGNTIALNFARSGEAQVTIGMMGLDEIVDESASLSASPDVMLDDHLDQFMGEIARNGATLGNIESMSLTFTNNMLAIQNIQRSAAAAGVDAQKTGATGTITGRYSNRVLANQALDGSACQITAGYSRDDNNSVSFVLYDVRLNVSKREVTGPGGIQAVHDYVSSYEPGSGAMMRATLRNDVESYALS